MPRIRTRENWAEWLSSRLGREIPKDAIGVVVKADGTVEVRPPEKGRQYKLEEMQKIVGGIIQVVPLPVGVVVCDEEGLYKDYKINELATRACDGHVIMKGGMMGDVLFCRARAT